MPSLREEFSGLLLDKKYADVLDKIRKNKGTVRTLTGLLYSEDDLVRWRAVTMFGILAEAEPEVVRPIIKRLLWFLNEESSTVGWGAAQAIGEIAYMNPEVAKDAIRVVVHFMDDEEVSLPANRNTPLLAGSIWTIGRLARKDPALAREMGENLTAYLGDPDPEIRALTVWTLGEVGHIEAAGGIRGLTGDGSEVRLYRDEELDRVTVGELAEAALKKLSGIENTR